MRPRKLFTLLLTGSLLFSSLSAHAGAELVYVLWSLNARAEMHLVQKLPDGEHKTLVSVQRDLTMDEGYTDHSGNIAYNRSIKDMADGEKRDSSTGNAASVARKITKEVLALQGDALNKAGISSSQASYSLLYAVAGFEAGQGAYPKIFNPEDVIKVQHEAEAAILTELSSREIQLKHHKVIRDTDLIAEIIDLMDARQNIVVFKTTYDLVCFYENDTLKTNDMRLTRESLIDQDLPIHPSGSVYSLGLFADQKIFQPDNSLVDTCSSLDQTSCQLEIPPLQALSKYLLTQYGISLTPSQLRERYHNAKRNNELGSRVLYMMLTNSYTEKHFQDWFFATLKRTVEPTLASIEAQAAAKQGNHLKVIFMGEHTEIVNLDLIREFTKKRLDALGVKMKVINREKTSQLIGQAGVVRLQKLLSP